MRTKDVKIESPCPVELVVGFERGERRFFCDHCDKNVQVLSNMTRSEAAAVLASRGADMCVTYLHDRAGNIHFKPEPTPALVPLARLRPRKGAGRRAAAVALALAACTPYAEREEIRVQERVETVSSPISHTLPDKPPAEPELEPELIPVAGGISAPPEEPCPPKPQLPAPELPDAPELFPAAGGISAPPELEPTLEPKPELEPEPELIPVAGGISALPPDVGDAAPALDEPCDKPAVAPTPTTQRPHGVKRGKIKIMPRLDE